MLSAEIERDDHGNDRHNCGRVKRSPLLQNERYVGVYSWNKRQVKYMGKWAGGKENPAAVKIDGVIPSIIDMEIWERVQKRTIL